MAQRCHRCAARRQASTSSSGRVAKRHNAHPSTSLKSKALLRRIWCYSTLCPILAAESSHVLGRNDPRRTLTQLPPLEVTALDHAQRRHGRDTNDLRRGLERDFSSLGPFAFTIDRNVMIAAE